MTSTKKWEEGVFSDLRNLKPGTDACLEEPKWVRFLVGWVCADTLDSGLHCWIICSGTAVSVRRKRYVLSR